VWLVSSLFTPKADERVQPSTSGIKGFYSQSVGHSQEAVCSEKMQMKSSHRIKQQELSKIKSKGINMIPEQERTLFFD
jgi:hypothetical protein